MILGFDMETDIGSWTPYYEGLLHGTPRILDVLAQHGVTGSFFFVGDAANNYPETARMTANAGHRLAATVCTTRRSVMSFSRYLG